MPETVILCGGAPRPVQVGKVLTLSLWGDNADLALKVSDISRRMVATLPPVLTDLLEVAAYVYGADQLISRGGDMARNLAADWRRDLRFVIPVRESDRWSSPEVRSSLERLLGFLADESYHFEFVAARDPPPADAYFDFGSGNSQSSTADQVLLFSGGLDSLTGAVDRLVNGDGRLVLVSHQSSTKIADHQTYLARVLKDRFPRRVLHVPVRITKHGRATVERTQRTRSFLFGAIAAVVARLLGASGLRLFENGIVSFNLPIASQVVGAAATRTTHPRVIRDMQAFLAVLLDEDIAVENPYLWKTKGEVAGVLRDAGLAGLARHTISCSQIHTRSRLHTHCGRCSQCLDRRFGSLAAGLGDDDPTEMYETDLLTGARERTSDRTMAESFVRHAIELDGMNERGFFLRFAGQLGQAMKQVPGMSSEEVARAAFDLHRRHAASVLSVLAAGYQNHATELAGQTLPSSCILRLVAGADGIARPERPLAEEPTPTEHDARDFGRSSAIRMALDSENHRVLVEGLPPFEGPAIFALVETLATVCEADRSAKRAPENHTFIRAQALANELGMTDQSLRRAITRLRRRLADGFEKEAGLSISGNALIETSHWHGYRLNPSVVVVAIDQLRPNRKGHDSPAPASQLPQQTPEKATT